jgi:hypothetical protein
MIKLCNKLNVEKGIILDKKLILKILKKNKLKFRNGEVNIDIRKQTNRCGKEYIRVYMGKKWILARMIYEYANKIKLKRKDFIKFRDNNPLNLNINNIVHINEEEQKIIRKAHNYWTQIRNKEKARAKYYIKMNKVDLPEEEIFWSKFRYKEYRRAYKLQWIHNYNKKKKGKNK